MLFESHTARVLQKSIVKEEVRNMNKTLKATCFATAALLTIALFLKIFSLSVEGNISASRMVLMLVILCMGWACVLEFFRIKGKGEEKNLLQNK